VPFCSHPEFVDTSDAPRCPKCGAVEPYQWDGGDYLAYAGALLVVGGVVAVVVTLMKRLFG
jgi:hypothetical protein